MVLERGEEEEFEGLKEDWVRRGMNGSGDAFRTCAVCYVMPDNRGP